MQQERMNLIDFQKKSVTGKACQQPLSPCIMGHHIPKPMAQRHAYDKLAALVEEDDTSFGPQKAGKRRQGDIRRSRTGISFEPTVAHEPVMSPRLQHHESLYPVPS